jgi:hypothetical protein
MTAYASGHYLLWLATLLCGDRYIRISLQRAQAVGRFGLADEVG